MMSKIHPRYPRFALFVTLLIVLLSGGAAVGQEQRVRLVFEPATPADSKAVAEYQALWAAEGVRIVKALEARTGLSFEEFEIGVVVVEAASSSGFGAKPMRMRASYPASTKKATLIHELGHRLQGRFFRKGVEDHPFLFLYLYDVWVELYGQEFAEREMKVESRRKGIYDYESAWRDALGMTAAQRLAKWQEFLKTQKGR
jgi:hypothetical protein